MKLTVQKLRKCLNPSYLKVKPSQDQIDAFKKNFTSLLDQINEKELEEYHKNIVSEFLKKTYYDTHFYMNTKGRNDLVIHTDKMPSSDVGVIIEAKNTTNTAEMLKIDNINCRALHELILYFLRERIKNKNLEVKHLIATNVHDWFIFDATTFENLFARNKTLVKQFIDFEDKRLSGKKTDFFYDDILAPFLSEIKTEISFTYFSILDFEKYLRATDKKDDNKLIPLYKVLSPEHLLKLPFVNDSNSLDKSFYSELLHIIGLTEIKEGSKRLIERKSKSERNAGSFLENAIIEIDSLDKISKLTNPIQYGATNEERLFTVGLELAITWINRVLFLKLLEAQLISYNKGNTSFGFLNLKRIKNYSDLNSLFFSVLAKPLKDRRPEVKEAFKDIPYLNSSLFEITPLEDKTVVISNIKERELPILSTTVLKDSKGKRRTGSLDTLEYLFEFLNAYDFASEGAEEIQNDNKTLINASVLGLIFEKINGYKDGSFFTPGFITMRMSQEAINRAIVEKFNVKKGWTCETIDDLFDKIDDKKEANEIINSVKICDPAVGSGHFLVSALNEIIAIKSKLKVLLSRDGKSLRDYQLKVVNDELITLDEDGRFFEYNPRNEESQKVQEALFHEKKEIIEKCLFGVDINSNSVKICRLRLWIELLKNAYYKWNSNELETLPNIDINIKCGNSLISRHALNADVKDLIKKHKWTIPQYRNAVNSYRNAKTKDEKLKMDEFIAKVKSEINVDLNQKSKEIKDLQKFNADLKILTTQTSLFEMTAEEKKQHENAVKDLKTKIKKQEDLIEEIKTNKIYENAFEWRFEFPEILNDDGDFVGFDIIIGNPPYGVKLSDSILKEVKGKIFNSSETAILFIALARNLLVNSGFHSFIIPKAFTFASNYKAIRDVTKDELILLVDCNKPWQEVKLEACLYLLQKGVTHNEYASYVIKDVNFIHLAQVTKSLVDEFEFFLTGITSAEIELGRAIIDQSIYLGDVSVNKRGVGIQSQILESGAYKVLGGIDIKRESVKDTCRGYINDIEEIESIGKIKKNSVLVQNIVAHITQPQPHIKIIACLPPEKSEEVIILDTINQIAFEKSVSHKFGASYLNSKLVNWYVYNFIYGKAIRTMHFDNVVTNRIPFPKAYAEKKAIADKEVMKQGDTYIYGLFNLSEEDIELIESNF